MARPPSHTPLGSIGAVILSPTKLAKLAYNHDFIIYIIHIKSLSPLLPITMDSGFTQWRDLGIQTPLEVIFINESLASFSKLQQIYRLGTMWRSMSLVWTKFILLSLMNSWDLDIGLVT